MSELLDPKEKTKDTVMEVTMEEEEKEIVEEPTDRGIGENKEVIEGTKEFLAGESKRITEESKDDPMDKVKEAMEEPKDTLMTGEEVLNEKANNETVGDKNGLMEITSGVTTAENEGVKESKDIMVGEDNKLIVETKQDWFEEDKKLMTQSVRNICFHDLSHRKMNRPDEAQKEDDEKPIKERRESVMRHLVHQFMENKRKTIIDNSQVCKDEKTSENEKTPAEIRNEGSTVKPSDGEVEETNSRMDVVDEEPSECENNANKNYESGVNEIKHDEITNKEKGDVGDLNNNSILKTENSCYSDIGLTPEEEEELISLLLLAESEYCDPGSIKNEIKLEPMDEKNDKIRITCGECLKRASELYDTIVTSKQIVKETEQPIQVHMTNNTSSTCPMDDVRSPFHISEIRIPAKYYQDLLAANKWNPTGVLNELSVQCNWSTPEFRLINYTLKDGYWFSVKVNNFNFVSYKKARSKREAKHLASARFLKFIGFRFYYEALTRSERRIRYAKPPWEDRYLDYNSITLLEEEERLGLWNYPQSSKELITYFDNFCEYKRKRSSSIESKSSRGSKIRRTSSPESDSLRRRRLIDKAKRVKLWREESEERRIQSSRDSSSEGKINRRNDSEDERRRKSRRDISPCSSSSSYQKKTYIRMEEERRKPKMVHERISVTHIYDCKEATSRFRDETRRYHYH